MPNDYNPEAEALAEQVRQFDEARRQTATAPSMDKALAGIDWSTAAPPGVDPRAYVEAMVAKGADAFTSDAPATAPIPRPRTLNIKSQGSTRTPADAKPGDVVEIDFGGGHLVEVEVEQAVRQGFIKRDLRYGGYVPFGADEIEAEKAEKQRQQQDGLKDREAQLVTLRASGDEPSAAVQSTVELVNSRVPGQATIAAIEDYIQNGTLSLANVHKIAAHAGWQPQQAEQITEGLVTGWYEQAARAVVSAGVPSEEVEAVYAYAAKYHPLDHKNAARNLVLASDASKLKDLATRYLAWKRR